MNKPKKGQQEKKKTSKRTFTKDPMARARRRSERMMRQAQVRAEKRAAAKKAHKPKKGVRIDRHERIEAFKAERLKKAEMEVAYAQDKKVKPARWATQLLKEEQDRKDAELNKQVAKEIKALLELQDKERMARCKAIPLPSKEQPSKVADQQLCQKGAEVGAKKAKKNRMVWVKTYIKPEVEAANKEALLNWFKSGYQTKKENRLADMRDHNMQVAKEATKLINQQAEEKERRRQEAKLRVLKYLAEYNAKEKSKQRSSDYLNDFGRIKFDAEAGMVTVQ